MKKQTKKQTRFELAVKNTAEMMKKSAYYTADDLKRAVNIAKSVIEGSENITLIKRGNHKLGKNVLIWDLPEIICCKSACKGCYAVKASRIYKNTRIMRLYHLILIELACVDTAFQEKLLDRMTSEILNFADKIEGITALRLHSAGDIYRNEYLTFILKLADRLKFNNNIKIYTYTKYLLNNDIDFINKNFNNINIIKSIFNIKTKWYLNFGDIDYIKTVETALIKAKKPYYICQYGMNKGHEEPCMSECKACLYNDIVLFKKH